MGIILRRTSLHLARPEHESQLDRLMRVVPVGSAVQRLQSSTRSVSGFISHAIVSVLPGINAVIRDRRLVPSDT